VRLDQQQYNMVLTDKKKLEAELFETKTENERLVFELKVSKTRTAVLEEKLANIEVFGTTDPTN
jgi:hypothetical protein